MNPAWCRRCGGPLVEGVPPGEGEVRHHCPACGHVEYLNPRVRAGCICSAPGAAPTLRTVLLRPGERLQAAAMRAVGVSIPEDALVLYCAITDRASAEDALVLYCAITDRASAEISLVFRATTAITPAGQPEDEPGWQTALLGQFARDLGESALPVYTAEMDGLALRLRPVDTDR